MSKAERLQAQNDELKVMLAKLLLRVDALLARIDELETRLKQDSGFLPRSCG